MQRPLAGNPAFTKFWVAETVTVLAYQMIVVAIGWQVYDLTRSTLSLGLVGLAHFGAQVLFSIPAGHLADRLDRRRVVLVCQLLQIAVALVLALAGHAGAAGIEIIYVVSFFLGVATTFQNPSLRSMLPGLVGQAELPRAIAWSATTKKAATIIGPALGGAIYLAGPGAVYGLSSAAYVAAGCAVLTLHRLDRSGSRESVTLRFMLGGFAYIRGHKAVLGAISLDLFATLFGGVTALLPAYARDILQIGPDGLGLLRAAPALGAVMASVYLARTPLARGVGRTLFASVAVFGIATIVFGVSISLPLSLAALMVLGAADMVSLVIRASLVQLETPDEMRGRVSSVSQLFTGTSNQLGQFQAGLMASLLGTVPAVVVGGCATLAIIAVWMRLFPGLVRRQALLGKGA